MDLVVVSGYTGSGKSTIATAVADSMGATVVSFDWLMSALRSVPDVWAVTELPVERQRSVGWLLLGRVAEQQLRRGASCVLDLVARTPAIASWRELAEQYGARFTVIECHCSDVEQHLSRVSGRRRDIPGWYELSPDDVTRSRENYEPLPADDKITIDTVDPLEESLNRVLHAIGRRSYR
jgi:predicted kinase